LRPVSREDFLYWFKAASARAALPRGHAALARRSRALRRNSNEDAGHVDQDALDQAEQLHSRPAAKLTAAPPTRILIVCTTPPGVKAPVRRLRRP
jgi:hypothetical protein